MLTDEGIINIEKLSSKHRIQGSSIVKITRSTGHRYIINIPKNSLCLNVPSCDTKCSLEHKIFYQGVMLKARNLVSKCAPVRKVINHQTVDENIDPKINFTFGKAQKRNVDVALSNTFGFGGHNACVLFKKIQ